MVMSENTNQFMGISPLPEIRADICSFIIMQRALICKTFGEKRRPAGKLTKEKGPPAGSPFNFKLI